jgi:hypothetical protein
MPGPSSRANDRPAIGHANERAHDQPTAQPADRGPRTGERRAASGERRPRNTQLPGTTGAGPGRHARDSATERQTHGAHRPPSCRRRAGSHARTQHTTHAQTARAHLPPSTGAPSTEHRAPSTEHRAPSTCLHRTVGPAVARPALSPSRTPNPTPPSGETTGSRQCDRYRRRLAYLLSAGAPTANDRVRLVRTYQTIDPGWPVHHDRQPAARNRPPHGGVLAAMQRLVRPRARAELRAARAARNPRTGESVKVKKTSVPAFRPGASWVVRESRTRTRTDPLTHQPTERPSDRATERPSDRATERNLYGGRTVVVPIGRRMGKGLTIDNQACMAVDYRPFKRAHRCGSATLWAWHSVGPCPTSIGLPRDGSGARTDQGGSGGTETLGLPKQVRPSRSQLRTRGNTNQMQTGDSGRHTERRPPRREVPKGVGGVHDIAPPKPAASI